jgi:hypothetical protein
VQLHWLQPRIKKGRAWLAGRAYRQDAGQTAATTRNTKYCAQNMQKITPPLSGKS